MDTRSAKWRVIFALSVAVLALGGLGFIYKITEFARTIAEDDVEGFGVISVTTYLVGVLAIFFVTIWAILKGHFRNIEQPKYRMLELDEEIERMGNVVRE